MKKYLIGLSMVLLSAVAWALPSVQEVQAQVNQGHYTQAESMMKEVVDAKPDSAKAHYIYAQLLAHNGNFSKATAETAKAKEIDPSLKFDDPAKFRAFEALLQREQNPPPRAQTAPVSMGNTMAPAPAPERSTGVPSWVWGVALAIVAFLLWRGFTRSRGVAGPTAGPAYGNVNGGPGYGVPSNGMPPQPYGTPYGTPYGGQPPVAPSAGGGLLRTGVAVAGGVAAGMLADELLNKRREGGGLGGNDSLSSLQNPMFGPQTDNAAANELENRNIDFGNGGDWDSNGGGSSDVDLGSGGGGGGDDGGWN